VPSVIGTRVERLLAPAAAAVTLLIPACEQRASEGPALTKLSTSGLVIAAPRRDDDTGGSAIRRLPVPECPAGMVPVEGEYCPKVEHRCAVWLDPPGRFRRCQRYEKPARCLVPRKALHFCIERDEHVSLDARLPVNRKSFLDAGRICADAGRRLCKESEWNFACEGEELRPYPYGWERDSSACNADHLLLAAGGRMLRDLRSGPGAFPRCASPFGVLDMSGNLEELVARDDRPSWPALKGAHWLPGRNHCRARQTIHGRGYAGIETGFRCCSDPPS
jgi:hypothetical protein